MSTVLLCLSIFLGSARNIFSKGISDLNFGTKEFFTAQSLIFISGSIVLTAVSGNVFGDISALTVIYSLIYALLLISAQCCYTAALKKGNTGICSTIYALGFIFPTLSGSIFWDEKLTVLNLIGIILVIPAIIISGKSPKKEAEQKNGGRYIFPLVCAMIASGGLGIMQKVQQKSPFPEQREIFIILAFAMSGLILLALSLLTKATQQKCHTKKAFSAMIIGIAFAFCNLLNTILAGMLDSAVFFPALNIGTILFSVVSGIIIYKEKILKKDIAVLILGIISVFLIVS